MNTVPEAGGGPGTVSAGLAACDDWLRGSLAGADDADGVWLARARGVALAGSAFTLAMSAWKAVGPLSTSDLFLVAAVLLMLPRFELMPVRRFWVPALAVALITVGGVAGTFISSSSEVGPSFDVLMRFVLASFGSLLLVACWRPDMTAVRSFSWLWIAGGIVSAIVAFTIPDLHMFLRPSGLAPHPTHLALISLILFGVSLGLVISDRRPIVVWPGLAAAAVLFAAVVVSGSRAGLGAAAIIAILVLIAAGDRVVDWARENVVTAVVIVILLVTALVLFGFVAGDRSAFDRLFGGDPASDQLRDAYNEDAWARFKSDPVVGVGFADAADAHNFFLQVGSASGIVGLVGAVLLVVLALKSYWVAGWQRRYENPTYWSLAAALAASVIGYLVLSLFQNVIWDRNIWILFAFTTWTCMAFTGGDETAEPEAT